MVKDWRPGPGMPFLDSDTCEEEGRGYLFLPGFSSLYDAIHGWMTGRMDGKSFTTTTSFTICIIPFCSHVTKQGKGFMISNELFFNITMQSWSGLLKKLLCRRENPLPLFEFFWGLPPTFFS
jgi:hypothetical protein